MATGLLNTLSQVNGRFSELATAVGQIHELDEKARARVQQEMDRIKERAFESDPKFLVDLVVGQPEQAEIQLRWSAYRQSLNVVRDCFDESRRALLALAPASESARNAFDAIEKLLSTTSPDLRRLRPSSILADLNTLKGILTSLLIAKGKPKSKGTARRLPRNVEIIKHVQELSAANFSDVEICARLANSARPEGARWSGLSWPNALKENRNAVSKWLSEARSRRLK